MRVYITSRKRRLVLGGVAYAFIIIAGLVVGGGACQSGSGPSRTDSPDRAGDAFSHLAPSDTQPAEPGLQIKIATDRDTYRLGELIIVHVTLQNVERTPITIPDERHGHLPRLQLEISGPAVETKAAILIAINLPADVTIPPGGSFKKAEGINGPQCFYDLRKPGRYTIKAVFCGGQGTATGPSAGKYWSGRITSNPVLVTVK